MFLHFSLRRQYPPITLLQLQTMIDTNRIAIDQPIDITQICNTGLFDVLPDQKQFGFQLTDEGADLFKSKINIEVQHASELVIATIEKNGGSIRTAYYDPFSLHALKNPKKWFEKGAPIPLRQLPPQDAVDYYSNPKNRGYLADPEEVSKERLVILLKISIYTQNTKSIFQVLSQKYGYKLLNIEKDPQYNLLCKAKDPRQVFYGLEPNWVINLKDKTIIKQLPDSN